MNRADQAVSTGQNHVPFVESVSGGFLIKSVMNTRTKKMAVFRVKKFGKQPFLFLVGVVTSVKLDFIFCLSLLS